MRAFKIMINDDTSKSREEVTSVFEDYYKLKKHNLAKLADPFAKGILNKAKNN